MRRGNEITAADQIDTLVGEGTNLTGEVHAEGTLRIDGKIEGQIMAGGDVVVGEKGLVVASVEARNLTIGGLVRGNITLSGNLHILSTGKLVGDVATKGLTIDEGAAFKGRCEMEITEE